MLANSICFTTGNEKQKCIFGGAKRKKLKANFFRSRSSIAITVPQVQRSSATEEIERVSVASSFVTETEQPRQPRRAQISAPPFSTHNEGVVTAVEETSTLRPPPQLTSGRGSSSPERSVTFSPDLPKRSTAVKVHQWSQRERSSRPLFAKRSEGDIKKVKKRSRKKIFKLTRNSASPSPSRKKDKKKLDISVHGVPKFSDAEASDPEDYAPPRHLSPRSAAVYVKTKLKEAAVKRKKKKKKRKGKKSGRETPTKKKKKKKKGRKKKKKKEEFGDSEELEVPRPTKPLAPSDQHFYPTPRNLFKKRCMFSVEPKPVVCSICDGIHYRTKRNFAANLRIIVNVNRALTDILNDMRNRMKKIDNNLVRVKRNLEYLEEMYEGVFRKVNRLISQ